MSTTKEMLKAQCSDPKCQAALCFSKRESVIECFFCGQKHKKDVLANIQEVSEDEKEWVVKNLVRRMQVGIPKRNAEFTKVLGLSNYYCKLLSHLLTHYGMNNKTSLPELLCDLNQVEILDCSVFCDRAFLIAPHQISIPGFGRDVTGSMNYLAETLNLIKAANGGEERLVPIHTDGDGHCLVHAVSRALVGRELFWHPLRCALKGHFEDNLEKYKELFKDFIDTDEWPFIIEECDPDFKPPDGELHGLRNIHIFGLANVLRRPIILLDSLECMKKCGDYSALFLPGFVSPEGCRGKDNSLNKPICIAWSSFSHNHYIPLVGVQNMPLPVLPMSLVPKAWGIPQSQIPLYIECDNNENCIIGGNRSLSDNYIHRLVAAMEMVFFEQNRVHPSIVADTKLYLCQNNAFLSTKVSTIIEVARMCVEQGRLYRCHSCSALTELRVDSEHFRRGGEFYVTLMENYHKLEPDVPYMLNGICCKYNPISDSVTVDLGLSYLERCTWCNSIDVRKLIPNGTECEERISVASSLITNQMNASVTNSSKTPANSEKTTSIKQEFQNSDVEKIKTSDMEKSDNKNFVNTNENPVQDKSYPKHSALTIKLQWNKKAFEHILSWSAFQKCTGENLNNAIFQLTSELINIHFPDETNNKDLWAYVEREIRQKVEKEQVPLNDSVTDDMEEDIDSRDMKSPISGVQYVKLYSSKGEQANLLLTDKGITYEHLRTFIRKEFRIPVSDQKIKIGFPPKEIEPPLRNNQPLPLKHGDRLMVESCPRPNYQAFHTHPNTSSYRTIGSIGKEDSTLERDVVWKIAIAMPDDFKRGGCYHEEVTQKHILSDMTHVSIDCFPFKSFAFNEDKDCLELCVKSIGHFEISPDLDDRINQASHGQTPKGFRKCSYMGVSKDQIIVRTMKKVIPIKKDSDSSLPASLVRKGPGFSILRTSDDDMDMS